MADPCICSDNLDVTDTGELCAIPGSIGLRELLVITASTTFDKATYPWLARVRAVVVGGGGGGGGVEATTPVDPLKVAAGAGGGGGGGAEVIVDVASLLASETVTVGAGGSAGSGVAGGAGGSSVFGAHAVATGGGGGGVGSATSSFDAAAVAAGGAGTTGDVLYQGSDGDAGIACIVDGDPRIAIGGSGGGSLMAGRTRERIFGVGGVGFANSGRGGFGASIGPDISAAAGRPGGSGIVLLYLYA